MFRYLEEEDKEYDYLNRNKTRNFKNTNCSEYNCGGYALQTFNWYVPFNCDNWRDLEEEITQSFFNGKDLITIRKELLNEAKTFLCNDFKNLLYPIDSLNKTSKSDTIIAFRLGFEMFEDENSDTDIEFDFHFRIRKDNIWSEKCGEGPVYFDIEYTEDSWYHGWTYDGDILYFKFNE